jgi:KUP system potassium uptake protein
MAALGVVYGDLGTSPLYTMQTIVGVLGPHATAAAGLGVLSLIVWTLLITISLKYCLFVMRADNHGEGGILALLSLVGLNDWRRGAFVGATMGLLGAALIYGDGVITPAISVLSALEGVNVVTATLKPFILPVAVAILATLFAVQRFGTAKIGVAFGPIMLAWFVIVGLLGLLGVVHHPAVMQAINPLLGLKLLFSSGGTGVLILGGVFLCATGGEALYADMGHFGARPIRLAWYLVVLPSLVLSYAGQTGAWIDGVPNGANPFFLLTPAWAVIPMVVLATFATIIASQAIITGSFSMTRQAMQLGWLPGFDIEQTSDRVYGQIYVPAINVMMAIGTIAITVIFKSSDHLSSAYGTAVSTTMVLTTVLLWRAMHKVWRWPIWAALCVTALFLVVDLSFFVANLAKIVDGGWIPLTLGVIIYILMVIWRTGVQALRDALQLTTQPVSEFLAELKRNKVPRVPGVGVFLTRSSDHVPAFITEYVRNIGALHATAVTLSVVFEEQPWAQEPRSKVEQLEDGLWHVTLRYGFVESPDLPRDLAAIKKLPDEVNFEKSVFFGARDMIVLKPHAFLTRVRLRLFGFLLRNSIRASDRFNLPPERTMEVARHVPL